MRRFPPSDPFSEVAWERAVSDRRHVGLTYVRFSPASEEASYESRHGTPAELLADADLLRVGALRHLDGADTTWSHTWSGSMDQRWYDAGPGFDKRIVCPGESCGSPLLDPTSCDPNLVFLPVDTAPLSEVVDASVGQVLMPQLIDSSGVVAGSVAGRQDLDHDPAVDAAVSRRFTAEEYAYGTTFDWTYYRDKENPSNPVHDVFRFGSVDERYGDYADEALSQDALLSEYLKALGAMTRKEAPAWGEAGRLRYLFLASEMERAENAENLKQLGWFGLRASELAEQCLPGVKRVFPGLSHPRKDIQSSLDGASVACSGCGVRFADYPSEVTRTHCNLDAVFFHMIKSAILVQVMEDTPDRFTDVLGDGIQDGWHGDDGLKAWLNEHDGEWDALNDEWEMPAGCDADAWREENPVDHEDTSPFFKVHHPSDLLYPMHREGMRQWARNRGLKCPFDIADFHWYGAKAQWPRSVYDPTKPEDQQFFIAEGPKGTFLYLSRAAGVVEAIRSRLHAWWDDGDAIPLWCSETGVSSHQNRVHIEPLVTDETDDGSLAQYYGLKNWGEYEVRVEPGCATEPYRGEDSAAADCMDHNDPDTTLAGNSDDPGEWPVWAFTSEHEQACQVWTRLSFLAGLGVERVFWFCNEVDPLKHNADTDVVERQQFYSYGLTHDLQGSDEPLEYADRAKKPAFCALRRWNQLFGNYRRAAVLPGLDGSQGYYGVVLERDVDEDSEPGRRLGLVLWADPQAYVSLDGFVGAGKAWDDRPPLVDGGTTVSLLPWKLRTAVEPTEVTTIPSSVDASGVDCPHGEGLLACVGVGEEPGCTSGGAYRAAEAVYTFNKDQPVRYSLEPWMGDGSWPVAHFVVDSDLQPKCFLLPAGLIQAFDDEGRRRLFDLCAWRELTEDEVLVFSPYAYGVSCE